jgi:hypothetical protein
MPHRSKRDFLCGGYESQTAAGEEEAPERLRRRTRGQDRLRGAEPEEKVGEAPEHAEAEEKVAPEGVDLDLEEVCLRVRGHRGAGDADHEGREGVKRGAVAGGLLDGGSGSQLVGDNARAGGEPAAERLRFDAHTDEASEPEHDLGHISCRRRLEENHDVLR